MNDPDALRYVGRAELEALLDPTAARQAIGRALSSRRPTPARSSTALGAGELLVMPAEDEAVVGVKVLTLLRDASRLGSSTAKGVLVLFDARDLRPVLLLDAAALTELRTAAVSAWVLERVAPPSASRLVLFGTGAQARSHLTAIAAVRPLSDVVIVGRRSEAVDELLRVAKGLGVEARGGSAAEVAEGELVVCCTASAEPLFSGADLPFGAVIVAIGSHHPDRRELDGASVARSTVLVESREQALREAGDLVIAATEGSFSPSDVAADLFELASGVPWQRSGKDCVLFKSVGMAFEDLAVGRAVLERC